MRRKSYIQWLIAGGFSAIILFLALSNFFIVKASLEKLVVGELDFSGFKQELVQNYKEKISQKEEFINLHGGFVRALGISVDNDVLLMDNGQLTVSMQKQDMSYAASEISVFSQHMEKMGIEFLYVQSPSKYEVKEGLLPDGVEDYTEENAALLMTQLELNAVPHINLMDYICPDAETMEKYFYRTDHHWTAEGAFVGFKKITEYLQERFPDQEIVSYATDREQWSRHTQKNFFLGYYGRRVGTGFAGTDDLIWLTPDFETNISCAIPNRNIFRKGSFADAALDKRYIGTKPDYFNSNPYAIHTGSDYPFVQFRSLSSPSDMKVLLVKDSFGLPVEGMLSTVFAEVNTVDLRHLDNATLMDKIQQTDPDVVIVMYSPRVYNDNRVFTLNKGVEALDETPAELITEIPRLVIEESEDQYNYAKIAVLENGKSYTLTIESLAISGRPTDTLALGVFDYNTNKMIDISFPDLVYIAETGAALQWTFRVTGTAEAQATLILYSGVPGESAGRKVQYSGVKLYEGIL